MFHSASLTTRGVITLAGPSTSGGKQRKPNKTNPKPTFAAGFNGERKDLSWKCVEGCGACCKLVKGPSFATPEEIFEDPGDVEHYKSLIGEDGWCKHYEKSTRTCSIYSERPYFCRVEPGVFETLYGIGAKRFHKEACGCCRDSIKAVYGAGSPELDKFNRNLKKSTSGLVSS